MKGSFYLAILLFLSCNNDAGTNNTVSDPVTKGSSQMKDSLPFAQDSNSQMKIKSPEGIYQTTLPCTDCKGLQHTIAFYKDKTFRLEEEKWGGKNSLSKTTGNWNTTNNVISLYKDQLVIGQYKWKRDTLAYVQNANEYSLHKLTSASENEVWKNKKKEGLEFFGVGNEPFWNIEIDEQKFIAFHLSDWEKAVRFKFSKPLVSADSISYNTSNDAATVQLTIYDQFCSDGMSDFIYSNKVKLVYNGTVYQGCGIFLK